MNDDSQYWQEIAQRAANYSAENMFPSHRGAYLLHPGVTCIFGNDGWATDERTRMEVALLREYLGKQCIEEIAFASAQPDESSWAMLVDSDNPVRMWKAIRNAWTKACGVQPDQTTGPKSAPVLGTMNVVWQRPNGSWELFATEDSLKAIIKTYRKLGKKYRDKHLRICGSDGELYSLPEGGGPIDLAQDVDMFDESEPERVVL